MRKIRILAGTLVIALVATACGSGSDGPTVAEAEPTAVRDVDPTPEPPGEPAATSEPTLAPEPTPEPEPTAAPETAVAPEPTATAEPVVLAADDRTGEFVCANQEAGVVRSDPALDQELETLIGPGVPGLVAATVSSDGLLRIGSAGERAIGGGDPMLPTDRVHLGSDTKSMTGALLALLSEQGGIGLDTPITDIWPEAEAGWQGVTLLDLLRHRGGAEDNLGRDQAALWTQLWQSTQATYGQSASAQVAEAMIARADFATTLTSAAPAETVGQYAYSNAGYMMVGAAIESALGSAWEDLMCEYLFKPLRMDGCGFGAPQGPGPQGHNGATGSLSAVDQTTIGADNPIALGPAGTVHCPIADWAKYISWVLRGAQGTDDLLSSTSWETLLDPAGDYASGWQVVPQVGWAQGRLLTHAGSNTMWFANAWVAPEIDRAYLVVANAATAEAQQATGSVSTILFGDG